MSHSHCVSCKVDRDDRDLNQAGVCSACRGVVETVAAWRGKGPNMENLPRTPEDKKGHPVFLQLLRKMEDTHVRKGADYSNPTDILSNLRACERFGVPSHKGILVRMSDKWERIQNLIMKEDQGEGPAVVNESLEDTLEDLANYALLMITVRRERYIGQVAGFEAPGWTADTQIPVAPSRCPQCNGVHSEGLTCPPGWKGKPDRLDGKA